MKKLSGFYNDYNLSGITYTDKIGQDYDTNDLPTHVTYKDMNEIKNSINNNIDNLSKFSEDIYKKISNLNDQNVIITDDEENAIMNKLGIS